MEKIALRLEYDHTWIDHPMQIITKIDDRVINVDVSGSRSTIIKKTVKLANDDHTLFLEISGKNDANTIVDDNGNVIESSLIFIKSFSLNEIELLPLLYHGDKFQTFYINNNPNQCINKLTEIGFNGTWKFNFKTPLYEWLLESLF